jgi:hypothetical protein
MVFWTMVAMATWELYQGLRVGAGTPTGAWPLSGVDVVFLVLIPALCALAFIRLFLFLTQSARGTLNIYAALSSPWAWLFWIGISITMLGHGIHVAGNAIWRQLPEAFSQGDFAEKIAFLDVDFGFALLALGVFFITLATLFIGHGASQRLRTPDKFIFLLGSLATYGALGILLGVGAQLYIAVIAANTTLTVLGLLLVPPHEILNDPITAFIIPGTFASGLILLIWTLIVGGQPTFG